MVDRVPIGDVVGAYGDYVALAYGLGLEVKKGHLREHALRGLEYRADMKSFFSPSYARQYPGRKAPARVFRGVSELRNDLADVVRRRLNGQLPAGRSPSIEDIVKALKNLDAAKLSEIASSVGAGRHGAFLKGSEAPIEEFRKALSSYSGDQSVARGKLVKHICAELAKRGVVMSTASVEERLRRNTKVRTVPVAMLEVAKGLDGSFKSGLVVIETMTDGQDPAEWVEICRQTLGFRSKNSMHKALAAATGVNYETVHKALTNPRAGRRIRVDLRDCLLGWLEKAKQGVRPPESVDAPKEGGAAPIVRPMLKELQRYYVSLPVMYSAAGAALGVGVASVRKIHEGGPNGHVKEEGIAALRNLLEARKNLPHAASYLNDRAVRRFAVRLHQKVEQSKRTWEREKDEGSHEAFKRLRLRMIIALKERRAFESVSEADSRPETEYAEAL